MTPNLGLLPGTQRLVGGPTSSYECIEIGRFDRVQHLLLLRIVEILPNQRCVNFRILLYLYCEIYKRYQYSDTADQITNSAKILDRQCINLGSMWGVDEYTRLLNSRSALGR